MMSSNFFQTDEVDGASISSSPSSITTRGCSNTDEGYRSHPFSLYTYHNEDTTCDADVDESSDYISGRLKSTITTAGTSKTSSMSSSTRSSKGRVRHKNKNGKYVTTFLTPPRRLIRSSPLLEFSPLSVSIQSSCTSSIGTESSNSDHSLTNISPKISVKEQPIINSISTVPETLYFRSFRNRYTKQDFSTLKKNLFDAKPFPASKKVTSKPSNRRKCTCRVSKALLLKCILFTYAYCISAFIITSMKINQVNLRGKAEALKTFTKVRVRKGNIRGKFIYPIKNGNLSSFQDSSQSITIKRAFGGFYPVFYANDVANEFKAKKRRTVEAIDNSNQLSPHPIGRRISRADYHPRIFSFSPIERFPKNHIVRELVMYPTVFSDNTQLYGIRASGDPALSEMEPIVSDKNTECEPMEEWQKIHHPSCNGIHELNLSFDNVKLIGKNGYWRNAWKVDFRNEAVILKTPKYDHNFEQAYYEHDRVDAQAMERLTFSPHVINVYGFCGRAVMSEFANGPQRLGTITDKARKRPLRQLEIARDIARGLSHVHFGQGEVNSTLVHLDVNPANIVVVDNTLKFNDFNIAIMLKKNATSGSTCGFPAQFPNPQWRSPEEVNENSNLDEKVDVFSLGHIFFRMICGHEPWNKLEVAGRPSSVTLREKVKAGILPRIPEQVMNTKIPEVQVIRDAMLACYTVNPDERPSSKEIAEFLDHHLSKLANGEGYVLNVV